MNRQNESARHEQSGDEPAEGSSTPSNRGEAPRKPTPFPRSERAVSQADGDA